MPDIARRLHDEWKLADDLAREAEQQLAMEWKAFFDGEGTPPKQEALELVGDMRMEASARLALLIEYMQRTTKQAS